MLSLSISLSQNITSCAQHVASHPQKIRYVTYEFLQVLIVSWLPLFLLKNERPNDFIEAPSVPWIRFQTVLKQRLYLVVVNRNTMKDAELIKWLKGRGNNYTQRTATPAILITYAKGTSPPITSQQYMATKRSTHKSTLTQSSHLHLFPFFKPFKWRDFSAF